MEKHILNYFIGCLIFLYSCGNSGNQSEKIQTEPTASELNLANSQDDEDQSDRGFFVQFEVDDFESWLNNFNTLEKEQLSEKFENLTIHQGLDDESIVIITGLSSDHQITLESFNNSDFLVNPLDIKWRGTNIPETDQAIFVNHGVGDYISWFDTFQDEESTRNQNGLYTKGIARNTNDPSMVTIYFVVDDIDKALGYITPELVRAMEASGVTDKPEAIPVRVVR